MPSIDDLIARIRLLDGAQLAKGARRDQLARIDQFLGRGTPEAYRELLAQIGSVEHPSLTIFGIGFKRLDLIANARAEWESTEQGHIPKHLLPIAPDGSGGHWCLDLSKPESVESAVVHWDPTQAGKAKYAGKRAAASFTAFVESRLPKAASAGGGGGTGAAGASRSAGGSGGSGSGAPVTAAAGKASASSAAKSGTTATGPGARHGGPTGAKGVGSTGGAAGSGGSSASSAGSGGGSGGPGAGAGVAGTGGRTGRSGPDPAKVLAAFEKKARLLAEAEPGEGIVVRGARVTEIALAEKALAVKFPPLLRDMLGAIDAAPYSTARVLGVKADLPKRFSMVDVTKAMRKKSKSSATSLVVIAVDEMDSWVVIDTTGSADVPVVVMWSDGTIDPRQTPEPLLAWMARSTKQGSLG